jgi:hypothetical protein
MGIWGLMLGCPMLNGLRDLFFLRKSFLKRTVKKR